MAQILLAFKKAYFGSSISSTKVEAYTLKDNAVLVDFYVVFTGISSVFFIPQKKRKLKNNVALLIKKKFE